MEDKESDEFTDECVDISTESDSDVFESEDTAIAETIRVRRPLRKTRIATISKMSVITESVDEETTEDSTDDGTTGSFSSIILMSDSELAAELDGATVY